MDLPVQPPVWPMLAKAVTGIPEPDAVSVAGISGLSFEPKWDGFRCLVFRDGDEIELMSRNTKPLTRYFPEVVTALREQVPDRCVLDGEVFCAVPGPDGTERLDFEVLQERIHPARSRIDLLADRTPARYVAFDLLALGSTDMMPRPFRDRRRALADVLSAATGPCHLTPTTPDRSTASVWFDRFEGAGLDGLIAKPLGAPYLPKSRSMLKIKHQRTADVVVAGYRQHKQSTPDRPLLGSLLLGLHADDTLQHVGVSASFPMARRAQLIEELAGLVCDLADHPWGAWHEWAIANPDRVPGTQSRWSAGKDLSFVPLRPVLVAEVGYDHMEGRRFRHTAQFKRWRPDRDPESCDYGQLEEPAGYDLATILRVG